MMGPVILLSAPPPDLTGLPAWAVAIYAGLVVAIFVAAVVLIIAVLVAPK
jgi:hypothetical protein